MERIILVKQTAIMKTVRAIEDGKDQLMEMVSAPNLMCGSYTKVSYMRSFPMWKRSSQAVYFAGAYDRERMLNENSELVRAASG